MRDELREWIVNDYFTPSIRAEVILDTLLTPYIAEIVNKQCGLDAVFVTKEMSVFDEFRKDKKGEAWLEEFFEYKCAGIEGRNCAERAKKMRKKKKSTNKYLYTMGQLLNYLHKYPNRTLWDLPLKLIYVTPTGSLPDEALRDHVEFYLYPKGKGSVSLWAATEDLHRAAKDQGDELADIITEIYGE